MLCDVYDDSFADTFIDTFVTESQVCACLLEYVAACYYDVRKEVRRLLSITLAHYFIFINNIKFKTSYVSTTYELISSCKEEAREEESIAWEITHLRCYAYAYMFCCLASNSAFIAEFMSQQRLCPIQSALWHPLEQ